MIACQYYTSSLFHRTIVRASYHLQQTRPRCANQPLHYNSKFIIHNLKFLSPPHLLLDKLRQLRRIHLMLRDIRMPVAAIAQAAL